MKYNILINQKAIIDNGFADLDFNDAAILNFINDFINTGGCIRTEVDGTSYYMISPQLIIDELPMLHFTSKRNIQIRIAKLISHDLLERCEGGGNISSSCFRLGKNWKKVNFYEEDTEKNISHLRKNFRTPAKNISHENTIIDNNKESNNINIITKESNEPDSEEQVFLKGMSEHYPNVQSLKQPLTFAQYKQALTDYGYDAVKDILLQMENCADLKKKYISANLTMRNWLKRRGKN